VDDQGIGAGLYNGEVICEQVGNSNGNDIRTPLWFVTNLASGAAVIIGSNSPEGPIGTLTTSAGDLGGGIFVLGDTEENILIKGEVVVNPGHTLSLPLVSGNTLAVASHAPSPWTVPTASAETAIMYALSARGTLSGAW
jgi:hypothetical protein